MIKRMVIIAIFAACLFSAMLASASAQGTFTYDSLITMNGSTVMESSNSIKDKKIRAEYKGQLDFVLISNGEKMYLYYPSSNSAMMLPVSNPQAQPSQDTLESLDYKNIPGLKSVGEETIEGHACEVYEYEKNGNATKMWVAKDLQFPIKIQTAAEGRDVVILNRNVKKNVSLSDSVFELPSGAQVADMGNMMDMMKSMKGMNLQ